MKRSHFLKTVGQVFLVVLTLAAGQAFAKVALNQPQGLAVDAKGNLYVANFAGNQILVYNPSYVQQTKRNISTNVSYPTGVAFDRDGNLFVSNAGTWSITKYTPAGVQTPAATITNGVQYPTAVAVDALNDVFVINDFQTYNVYDSTGYMIASNTTTQVVNTIATHGEWTVVGFENSAYTVDLAGPILANIFRYFAVHTQAATAAAIDQSGNAYVGSVSSSGDKALVMIPPASQFAGNPISLSYAPAGVAVDSVRSRAYVSNSTGNKIEVYSIAGSNYGTLLSTIQ